MPTGLRAMPALSCTDVDLSASDLSHAFGFRVAGTWRGEQGVARFAILQLGQITLALHKAEAVQAGPDWAVYLYIDDAAALAELARAQGAAVEGPSDQPWRCRELRFVDRDGNQLVFAEDLAPGPDGPGL
ncbi:MAG: VOC family protein [Pseudomonadota bacterium]